MSEAEEIEEAAGRVIDKLEIELGQLQARVAELERERRGEVRGAHGAADDVPASGRATKAGADA